MTRPQRIQLKRTKGFSLQSVSHALNGLDAVKVTRPGKWGNPFKVGMATNRAGDEVWSDAAGAVSRFRVYAENRMQREPEWLAPLRGKNLACFCGDKPCHADVLLDYANRTVQP